MDTARQLAAGNLAARIRVRREDELGELTRIINQSADELQRRLAEIARDRGRTDAILSAMDDGVLAVDHQGIVTLANPSLTRALALASPLGRHYLETIRQPEVGALVEDVLKSGERRELEVEVLQLRRAFTITGVPFPGAEGARHGAVLTFNDSTERQRLDAMRRDFVANASHELRTPLTSIRGFVEALEDGAKDEPGTAERFLGKIRTHADRMASLVEDLLELSRLESSARAPEPDETRPADVAADVVGSFAEQAARKPLTLRHEPHGAATVLTDRERLRRILENLVDNAVKYTPAGGHVVVTSLAEPGRLGARRGEGRRPRDRPRAPRADLRALLPRRQGEEPRARRHRARAVDRPAPGREHRRDVVWSRASPARARRSPSRCRLAPTAPTLRPRLRPEPARSEVEARAELLRDHRARVRLAPEHAVAHARHEIVEPVEERPREHARDTAEHPPRRPEPAEDVDHGAAARQQPSVARLDHEAVGECCAHGLRGGLAERVAVERREAEGAALAVAREHEAHGPVAERAGAVVEEPLGRRERPASRLLARHRSSLQNCSTRPEGVASAAPGR